jgi:hypothetical protein
MKYICLIFCILCTTLSALTVHDWSDIRFSERSSGNKLYLRTERSSAAYNINNAVYHTASGTVEVPLSLQNAVQNTFQAYVDAGIGDNYYGFRSQAGSAPMQIVPLHYSGTGLPAPNQLTRISDDPANDNATQYYDIITDYVALTDTKLIVGIKNRGGGFPSSGGFLSWNSYLCAVGDPGLEDPNDPDAVVWALHYVNAMGVMTPGLYKVTGTSLSDVTRIADIAYEIHSASNTLVMSCDFSVLLADPDFLAWFDPAQPEFGLISVTARVSMSGVVQQDNSIGGVIHPGPVYVNVSPEHFGEISDPSLVIAEDDVYFQAAYSKPADRFNWEEVNFVTDAREAYLMTTGDPETAILRNYRSANLMNALTEVEDGMGRVNLELVPGEFMQSAAYGYSFVRGIMSPVNVQIRQSGEDSIQISWDPVSQTPDGTEITTDFYRLEYADRPDGDFQLLLETDSPTVTIPAGTSGSIVFIRISAHKNLP